MSGIARGAALRSVTVVQKWRAGKGSTKSLCWTEHIQEISPKLQHNMLRQTKKRRLKLCGASPHGHDGRPISAGFVSLSASPKRRGFGVRPEKTRWSTWCRRHEKCQAHLRNRRNGYWKWCFGKGCFLFEYFIGYLKVSMVKFQSGGVVRRLWLFQIWICSHHPRCHQDTWMSQEVRINV